MQARRQNFNSHKQKEKKKERERERQKKKLPGKPSLKLDGKSNKKIK